MRDEKEGGRNGQAETGNALHEQWPILAIAPAHSQLKRMLN
jgi:hypothetical protein